MGKSSAVGLVSAIAAAAASSLSQSNPIVYADGPFSFSPFSGHQNAAAAANPPRTSPSSLPSSPDEQQSALSILRGDSAPKNTAINHHPRTSSSGFDPEPLERGAKAVKEFASSSHAKKVFEVLKKQEDSRQKELDAKATEFKAMQAQAETERQRVIYEEQKKLAEHRAQVKSQMAQYEDDLARKRMQADNEHQRARNQELVKLQEESSIRQEQARRATEEQIQAQRRQTEREKAEIERETIRVRAMAEAEGRAHEAKLAEDVNRRILIDRANAEREKWVAAINTTFDHVGGGLKAVLTDQNKLVVMVGGVTALAAGIYTTREGAKVMWSYVDRVLGQPSLIRESSRGKYPWSGAFKRGLSSLSSGASKRTPSNGNGFGDVILHPSLQKRIQQLANATANTKSHQAPFRNMLFYGPPGTGKTMAARELARKSGLDYALMTGGDVAPLGSQAVTKIHQLFDWAKKSKRGLLLFIDEADAFLCERNKTYMSEAQRSALNALLFRTGDQSKDIVLALATNRPGDLDSAVSDRVDEVLEFPLPGEDERFKLLKLYLDKYIAQAGSGQSGNWVQKLLQKQVQKIEMKDVTDEVIREAAAKTVGFSGREIAKLMAGVQAAVYGKRDCVLDPSLFREVVDYKVAEHKQRSKLGSKE
ncbi:ATPase family AAA domain-containing protein 3 [Linum perenne]